MAKPQIPAQKKEAEATRLAAKQTAEADAESKPSGKTVRLIALKNKLTNGVTMDKYTTQSPTVASKGLGNWEKAQIKAGLLAIVEDED